MTLPGLFLARSGVDRAAEQRRDDAWVAAAWAEPSTRVLVVAGGRALVRHADGRTRLVLVPAAGAPEGQRVLLGRAEDGTAYFAVAAEALPDPAGDGDGEEVQDAGLRELGAVLDDLEVGLLVNAVALEHWHRTHTHCPRCGAPTQVEAAGHVRRCPRDGSQHFPRTDPAVIMAVVDADDRLLLGRQATWPEGRYSTLAGFVEPGESLEAAVAREVLEESGIVVDDATYLGSQSWPFPQSIMLGFRARAASTAITTDDEEIVDALWLTREELGARVAEGSLRLPPAVSIARRLIEHWYGAEIDDGGGTWR
ncbi:NAD(+) diphosphatase [Vallicoccus soli]|uniref:NAD(+) diphosphatase n=1 Tax=Vallicoccus soli TaxID=2339232 RepID=A0A3A3Z3T2_9ACTN|nr:NAD(+) diphosphatase [Vallicoccus soli]RJK98074.1 NAD(+) diphosphatase [Vallicoccus soli]